MSTRVLFLAVLWSVAATAQAQTTMAITEFMVDPIGEDEAREYIELFNYGGSTVNLLGWKLEDDRGQSAALPDVDVPSGGFVIVLTSASGTYQLALPAERKALFEKEWFGGKADDRIIPRVEGGFDLRDQDQINLLTPNNKVAWQVAWNDPGPPGHATFYANYDPKVFKVTKKFGTRDKPGVVRRGNDLGVQPEGAFPGYEGNEVSQDVDAWKSDAKALADYDAKRVRPVDERGDDAEPGTGSPLKGDYPVFK